jgi:acyl carrier protein
MEKQEVFLKVSDMIREVLMAKSLKIEMDNNLADDLGMDSMAAVEFVNAVEDDFKIAINETEMQSIKTVNDAVTMILEKTDHKEA